MPVTSPIAHRRSPARRYSSTWMPLGLALTPTVSRPMPSTRGRRPVATSSRATPPAAGAPPRGAEQPVASQLRTVLELQDELGAVAPRGAGVHPEAQLD